MARLGRAQPFKPKVNRRPLPAAGPGDLVAGALTAQVSDDNIVLSGAAPSGGTGTVTRSLYRHTSPGFTAPGTGTLIDTSTSTGTVTWTDTGASFGVTYWYEEYCVDSAGSPDTANSAEAVAARWRPRRSVLLVGDSITANGYQYARMLDMEKSARGPRQVTYTNAGASSSLASQWAADTGGILTDALAAGAAATPPATICYVMLGTNKEANVAAYETAMGSLTSQLVAEGYTVYLFGPPYSTTLGDAWNADLIDYRSVLSGLDNGTTIRWPADTCNALVAAKTASGETSMLVDGVHYANASTGGPLAGDAMYEALDELLFPDSGGSGPVPMIGSPLIRSLQ